jgi:hypothetical protein
MEIYFLRRAVIMTSPISLILLPLSLVGPAIKAARPERFPDKVSAHTGAPSPSIYGSVGYCTPHHLALVTARYGSSHGD